MGKFNIDKFVKGKIELLQMEDKSFKSIYNLMFKDEDFVMFEWTDGAKIKKMTYGQCKLEIEGIARDLSEKLKDQKKGTKVGLYAQNSVKWIQVFWALLKCGYQPLLLNTKLDKQRILNTLETYEVEAVISDGEKFGNKTIDINNIKPISEGEDVNAWDDNIIVMSSGTSSETKLCFYNGKCFYYQLLDSYEIIKTNKLIKKHYQGQLKQLMFLPLYHIFGLAAMFMWFAFFSRSFVLLKDQSPETILLTIRKHKVTHIFAVPLFWETVYKKFQKALSARDEKTIKKAKTGLKIVQKLKSRWIGKKLLKPIREEIFGDSICFLISGGSSISTEVLTFFNSIGYPLANGYGMSEIGITSVELSLKYKNLTDASVGKPFAHCEYKLDKDGCLYVKSPSMAKEIYIDGKKERLHDGWYKTMDNAINKNGRYFITGRKDDMIIGADGENLNPAWMEKQILLDDVEDLCILNLKDKPTLLIYVSTFKALNQLKTIKEKARQELIRLGIAGVIQNIEFTKEPLLQGNDFKINRKKLQNIELINKNQEGFEQIADNEVVKKIKQIFANVLGCEEDKIFADAHFFFDLNGNSLEYFSLLSLLQKEFGLNFMQEEDKNLYTVVEFFNFIQKNN